MTEVIERAELPLPDGRVLQASEDGRHGTLALDGEPLIQFRLAPDEQRLGVCVVECSERDPDQAIWLAGYWLFVTRPKSLMLQWSGLPLTPAMQQAGLVMRSADGGWQTLRTAFWQLASPWLRTGSPTDYPQAMQMVSGVRFPRRPPKPVGEVYRRFDARLGSWISLRTLDIEQDLERFNRWQNTPRVEKFWEEGGTLETHRAHLQAVADDPHCLQLIGCFDDEPFAFFDTYWAREDRIGPYYEADHYDRGIHMLVGEERHRGPHKVASWLPALSHYLFLDEPRTRMIVSEPRSDNDRMIHHLQRIGFHRQKDFDFPHKRAALMALSRECFFDRCELC
ncbi:GNAT family N-acetyltransferase [Marinobacter sp. NFXS9]|uniref:GNAT family N-acetyltransferase n=1 Tax=Marinobacter sp. NFXS9 TaxID=2818433 RepID=UPI0032DF86DA